MHLRHIEPIYYTHNTKNLNILTQCQQYACIAYQTLTVLPLLT